jgi:uncharacterized membrane protein
MSMLSSEKMTILTRLRNWFLTGVLVTAPVALSLYIVWAAIVWVDRLVGGVLGHHIIPGVGFVFAVAGLTIIGFMTRNFLGQYIIDATNAVLTRVPVVKTIYTAIKQMFEMVIGNQAKAFREVVLIEFPREGVWTVAFITGDAIESVHDELGDGMVCVFVPAVPLPTSGFMLYVPRSKLKFPKLTVDEGIKLVVSAGLITPNVKS